MKTEWVELGTVQLRNEVVIRRQQMTVTQINRIGEDVTVVGKTEDGRQMIYIGVAGEAVQKVVTGE